jgi:Protein of unknown function (DUF2721)
MGSTIVLGTTANPARTKAAGKWFILQGGSLAGQGQSTAGEPPNKISAMNETYAMLSAMITPAIFLTANASLIISTSNRVSRVVDRIRVLNDQADQFDRGVTDLDLTNERMNHCQDQLHRLQQRSDRLRFALTALYLAFSSFVGTSLALALDTMLSMSLVALPTLLAMVGVGLLLFASVNLVREALAALRSNRLEIGFYHELRELRRRAK